MSTIAVVPAEPPLPHSKLNLGGSKFLCGLILYKHSQLTKREIGQLMGVTAGYLKMVYTDNLIRGYKKSLAYYKDMSVDGIMHDWIKSEGVHKTHPLVIQAYLSNHGWTKPRTIRPKRVTVHVAMPTNNISHFMGNGAFKRV